MEVSSPVQGVCHTVKRFGGQWLAPYKVGLDVGSKNCNCLDQISPKIEAIFTIGYFDQISWYF